LMHNLRRRGESGPDSMEKGWLPRRVDAMER
jgi:hypothetical protein